MSGMIAWLLAIIALAAPADAPRTSFVDVAAAVLDATGGDPFDSADLVALGAREGHFDPVARSTDYAGCAWGVWQVHESNFGWLGIDLADALDPAREARVALRLVRESRRVCRARPLEDSLGWYAAGGPTCDVEEGLRDSRNREELARMLLRLRPPPTTFLGPHEALQKRRKVRD